MQRDHKSAEAAVAVGRHAIEEHDVVALRERLGDWPAGTQGKAVSICEDAVLVEPPDLPHLDTLNLLVVVPADLLDVTWRIADHPPRGMEA